MSVSVFPAILNDIVVELYLNGWRDISTDVAYDHEINISRGVPPESTSFQTSQRATFNLLNGSGNYSPRNPMSLWYGIMGQCTPCRASLRLVRDQFANRTVSSSWGTTPTGETYTLNGTASNFAVSGGVGTVTLNSVTHQEATLSGPDLIDQEVSCVWSLAVASVTGAALLPANVVGRWTAINAYYYVRQQIAPGGAITLGINMLTPSGDTQLVAQTATGLTYAASTQYATKLQIAGDTIRAKIWLAANPEPYDWLVSITDTTFTHGTAGIRSGITTGNTNGTVVFTYDNLEVRNNRFTGEVSEWPPEWDTSGKDVRVLTESNGLLRRVLNGESPVNSILSRIIPAVPGLIAYWAMEDGAQSTSIAPGTPANNNPMLFDGTPQFAAYNGFLASNPILTTNSAYFLGNVGPNTVTGTLMIRWAQFMPATGSPNGSVVSVWTTGTAVKWEVLYVAGSGGQWQIRCWNAASTIIFDSGVFGGGGDSSPDGRLLFCDLELTQSGGNINYTFVTYRLGLAGAPVYTGTATGVALGSVFRVNVDETANLPSLSIGHLHLQNVITSVFAFLPQLLAFVGEASGARASRICAEEGLLLDFISGPLLTQSMGAQPNSKNSMQLLQECIDAEQGIVYENRNILGLVWRAIDRMYNQTPTLTLDYSRHHVSGPFKPTLDDLLLRNKIQVTRQGGSTITVQQNTGPLKVTRPADGGVGVHSQPITVNLADDNRLVDFASWMLGLGTTYEERYEQITVDRGNPNIPADNLSYAVLNVDIGHRVVVNNTKAGQSPGPVSQIVRGYTETLRQNKHVIRFSTVPESPYQVWQVDTLGLSALDSNATTLHANINSSVASFQIDISDGFLWSTSAGDYPLTVTCGGEDMTVTAVSGAATPQTITVTRSVNGVVKAHNAGDKISLRYPRHLAYAGG